MPRRSQGRPRKIIESENNDIREDNNVDQEVIDDDLGSDSEVVMGKNELLTLIAAANKCSDIMDDDEILRAHNEALKKRVALLNEIAESKKNKIFELQRENTTLRNDLDNYRDRKTKGTNKINEVLRKYHEEDLRRRQTREQRIKQIVDDEDKKLEELKRYFDYN